MIAILHSLRTTSSNVLDPMLEWGPVIRRSGMGPVGRQAEQPASIRAGYHWLRSAANSMLCKGTLQNLQVERGSCSLLLLQQNTLSGLPIGGETSGREIGRRESVQGVLDHGRVPKSPGTLAASYWSIKMTRGSEMTEFHLLLCSVP